MSSFTKQDAQELNMPLPLLRKWELVMNTLWSFFLAYAKKEKKVKIKNQENKIYYKLGNGHQYIIWVDFYNNSYLCLKIEIKDVKDFEVRISKIDELGKEGIIRTVANILTAAENVKK